MKTKNQTNKVKVSERALAARINRKLKPDMEALRKCRSEKWVKDLGYYYTIDLGKNCILDRHIQLENFGRELGALKPFEELEWDA